MKTTVKKSLKSLSNNRRGLSALEYSLMAVGVTIAIAGATKALGTGIGTTMTNAKATL